jgi:hypothetical protein
MKSALILGRGFGLYGYIPAALKIGWRVTTDSRYKEEITRRPELNAYVKDLELIDNPELEINSFDCVVIAKKPIQQLVIVNANLNYKGYFFLEKPLAPTISQHKELVARLKKSDAKFSIAYLFRYLDWYKMLVNLANKPSDISINWVIPTSTQNNWKSSSHEGGGIINYYLIHFLPLLIEMRMQENDLEVNLYREGIQIKASNHLGTISIKIIQSQSQSALFQIESIKDKKTIWISKSPFGQLPAFGFVDPRVEQLTQYLEESIKLIDSKRSVSLEEEILNLLDIIKIKAIP